MIIAKDLFHIAFYLTAPGYISSIILSRPDINSNSWFNFLKVHVFWVNNVII